MPQIVRSVGYVTAGILLGRLAGFLKHFVIVKYFGVTYAADVFFVANTVPDLSVNIILSGLLTGALIPIASEVFVKHGEESFSRFVTSAFLALGSVLLVAALILFLFSHAIGSAVAPGYSEEQHLMISKIFKVFSPGILFIGLAAVLSGIMQVNEKFFLPSLGLFIANSSTILFTIVFHERFGIVAPAAGTTIGFVLWFVMLVPPSLRWFRLTHMSEVIARYSKKLTRSAIPAIAVMFLANIIFVIEKAIASRLPEGTVSHLNLAFRLTHVFSGLLVIPLSVVLLPKLTKYHGADDRLEMYRLVKKAFRLVSILLFSSLSLIILNSEILTNLAYGLTGVSVDSLNVIAGYLTMYAFAFIGIFFYTIQLKLMYSVQKLDRLVIANMLGLVAYVLTAATLSRWLGGAALPVAYCSYAISTSLYIFRFVRAKIFRSNPPLVEKYLIFSGAILVATALFAKFYLQLGNYPHLVISAVLLLAYLTILKQKGFLGFGNPS